MKQEIYCTKDNSMMENIINEVLFNTMKFAGLPSKPIFCVNYHQCSLLKRFLKESFGNFVTLKNFISDNNFTLGAKNI